MTKKTLKKDEKIIEGSIRSVDNNKFPEDLGPGQGSCDCGNCDCEKQGLSRSTKVGDVSAVKHAP